MGKKLEDRRISAKDAKKLADSSEVMLTRIYKVIREEAEEGRVRLDWNTDYLSSKCKDSIVDALRNDGYSIETSDDTLIIKW